MKKNEKCPDRQELEKLLQELELLKSKPDRPDDTEFLNPWNLGKKKITGKTFVSARLPNKLPTQE